MRNSYIKNLETVCHNGDIVLYNCKLRENEIRNKKKESKKTCVENILKFLK